MPKKSKDQTTTRDHDDGEQSTSARESSHRKSKSRSKDKSSKTTEDKSSKSSKAAEDRSSKASDGKSTKSQRKRVTRSKTDKKQRKQSSEETNLNAEDSSNNTEKAGEGTSAEQDDSANKDHTSPSRSQGAQSPDPNCSICLGKLENKSFTDSCFHMFCFVCLLEWSKVKAVCPLCKQQFKSIIHNVRSFEDYDQYHIQQQPTETGLFDESRGRFRYRTTRWMASRNDEMALHLALLQRPSRTSGTTARAARMRMRRRIPITSAFRKRVYTSGMKVREVLTSAGRPARVRNISPEFFSRNMTASHRLVPWLNRELNVLLNNQSETVSFVVDLILDLIKQHEIQSPVFYQHMLPYMGRRTKHFVDELFSFARSPYDMTQYDTHAVYTEPLNPVTTIESSDSETDNAAASASGAANNASGNDTTPDVIVLSEDEFNPTAPLVGMNNEHRRRDHPYSSDFSTSSALPFIPPPLSFDPTPILSRVRDFMASANRSTALSGWDSPTPGPSYLDIPLPLSTHSSATTSSDIPSISSILNSISTTSYPIWGSTLTNRQANARNSAAVISSRTADSDSDDLLVTGYEKPWQERSPVPITSSGDSDASPEPVSPKVITERRSPSLPIGRHRRRSGSHRRSRSSRSRSRSPAKRPRHEHKSKKSKKKHKRRSRSRDRGHRSKSKENDQHRKERRKRHDKFSVESHLDSPSTNNHSLRLSFRRKSPSPASSQSTTPSQANSTSSRARMPSSAVVVVNRNERGSRESDNNSSSSHRDRRAWGQLSADDNRKSRKDKRQIHKRKRSRSPSVEFIHRNRRPRRRSSSSDGIEIIGESGPDPEKARKNKHKKHKKHHRRQHRHGVRRHKSHSECSEINVVSGNDSERNSAHEEPPSAPDSTQNEPPNGESSGTNQDQNTDTIPASFVNSFETSAHTDKNTNEIPSSSSSSNWKKAIAINWKKNPFGHKKSSRKQEESGQSERSCSVSDVHHHSDDNGHQSERVSKSKERNLNGTERLNSVIPCAGNTEYRNSRKDHDTHLESPEASNPNNGQLKGKSPSGNNPEISETQTVKLNDGESARKYSVQSSGVTSETISSITSRKDSNVTPERASTVTSGGRSDNLTAQPVRKYSVQSDCVTSETVSSITSRNVSDVTPEPFSTVKPGSSKDTVTSRPVRKYSVQSDGVTSETISSVTSRNVSNVTPEPVSTVTSGSSSDNVRAQPAGNVTSGSSSDNMRARPAGNVTSETLSNMTTETLYNMTSETISNVTSETVDIGTTDRADQETLEKVEKSSENTHENSTENYIESYYTRAYHKNSVDSFVNKQNKIDSRDSLFEPSSSKNSSKNKDELDNAINSSLHEIQNAIVNTKTDDNKPSCSRKRSRSCSIEFIQMTPRQGRTNSTSSVEFVQEISPQSYRSERKLKKHKKHKRKRKHRERYAVLDVLNVDILSDPNVDNEINSIIDNVMRNSSRIRENLDSGSNISHQNARLPDAVVSVQEVVDGHGKQELDLDQPGCSHAMDKASDSKHRRTSSVSETRDKNESEIHDTSQSEINLSRESKHTSESDINVTSESEINVSRESDTHTDNVVSSTSTIDTEVCTNATTSQFHSVRPNTHINRMLENANNFSSDSEVSYVGERDRPLNDIHRDDIDSSSNSSVEIVLANRRGRNSNNDVTEVNTDSEDSDVDITGHFQNRITAAERFVNSLIASVGQCDEALALAAAGRSYDSAAPSASQSAPINLDVELSDSDVELVSPPVDGAQNQSQVLSDCDSEGPLDMSNTSVLHKRSIEILSDNENSDFSKPSTSKCTSTSKNLNSELVSSDSESDSVSERNNSSDRRPLYGELVSEFDNQTDKQYSDNNLDSEGDISNDKPLLDSEPISGLDTSINKPDSDHDLVSDCDISTDKPETDNELVSERDISTDKPDSDNELVAERDISTDKPNSDNELVSERDISTDRPNSDNELISERGISTDRPNSDNELVSEHDISTDRPNSDNELVSEHDISTDKPDADNECASECGVSTDKPESDNELVSDRDISTDKSDIDKELVSQHNISTDIPHSETEHVYERDISTDKLHSNSEVASERNILHSDNENGTSYIKHESVVSPNKPVSQTKADDIDITFSDNETLLGNTTLSDNGALLGNNTLSDNDALLGNNTLSDNEAPLGNNTFSDNDALLDNTTLSDNEALLGNNTLSDNEALLGNNTLSDNEARFGNNTDTSEQGNISESDGVGNKESVSESELLESKPDSFAQNYLHDAESESITNNTSVTENDPTKSPRLANDHLKNTRSENDILKNPCPKYVKDSNVVSGNDNTRNGLVSSINKECVSNIEQLSGHQALSKQHAADLDNENNSCVVSTSETDEHGSTKSTLENVWNKTTSNIDIVPKCDVTFSNIAAVNSYDSGVVTAISQDSLANSDAQDSLKSNPGALENSPSCYANTQDCSDKFTVQANDNSEKYTEKYDNNEFIHEQHGIGDNGDVSDKRRESLERSVLNSGITEEIHNRNKEPTIEDDGESPSVK